MVLASTIWKVINHLIKEIPNRLDLHSLPASQSTTFILDLANLVLILGKFINDGWGSVCTIPSTLHQGMYSHHLDTPYSFLSLDSRVRLLPLQVHIQSLQGSIPHFPSLMIAMAKSA